MKTLKLRSKALRTLVDSAKDIQKCQKIHWENFQVVVLTLSSSKNNFILHWKMEKSQEIRFFKKRSLLVSHPLSPPTYVSICPICGRTCLENIWYVRDYVCFVVRIARACYGAFVFFDEVQVPSCAHRANDDDDDSPSLRYRKIIKGVDSLRLDREELGSDMFWIKKRCKRSGKPSICSIPRAAVKSTPGN